MIGISLSYRYRSTIDMIKLTTNDSAKKRKEKKKRLTTNELTYAPIVMVIASLFLFLSGYKSY